jgi:hypothetical protein
MVLEPISAIGIAGNIIQFIDFLGKIFSESREAYHSAVGSRAELIDLEVIAKHIEDLTLSLQLNSSATQRSDLFASVQKSCLSRASELLGTINRLKVQPGPHRRWHSFQHAIRSVWKKDKIHGLQVRLRELQSQITAQMMCVHSFHVVLRIWQER